MSNPFFQFKQFTIRHDKCAMKVGTDGVLLGAWAGTESCNRILDIGTGTGLIALMLAQRSKAAIDAIDIEADACLQAQENAESSLFAGRINVFHSDLVDFAQASTHLYDLIVSNPPYFVDSLKCPNLQRNTARHTDICCSTVANCLPHKDVLPLSCLTTRKIVLRIVFKHKICFFRRKSPSSPYPIHNRNDCWPN